MKTYKIVKDRAKLKSPCVPCRTIDEGLRVGTILKAMLKESKDGVGLAANQIGINLRVCIINVKRPILLVNPRIVNKFDKFLYKEGCLSFPGDYVTTERYKNIMVEADNHKKMLIFSSDTPEDMLECACIQHEIDHLDGITMFDRGILMAQPKAADLLIRGIKDGK
jgi:peptide deformylase